MNSHSISVCQTLYKAPVTGPMPQASSPADVPTDMMIPAWRSKRRPNIGDRAMPVDVTPVLNDYSFADDQGRVR
jgi:hypothetical protein